MTDVLKEQPFTAAKRVCEAFGVAVSARQGGTCESAATEFRELLEKLLVAKSPDFLVQLAAALLPHVPDISEEAGAAEGVPEPQFMEHDAGLCCTACACRKSSLVTCTKPCSAQ